MYTQLQLQQALLASRNTSVGNLDLVERILNAAYDRSRADRQLDRVLAQYTGLTPHQVRSMTIRAQGGLNLSLSPSSVHVDSAMSNFFIGYANRKTIADECLPVVDVMKRSDKIFALPVETMQQVANVAIAGNRGRPKEVQYSVTSSDNYSVVDYGLMDFVSSDEESNADAPLRPRMIASSVVTSFLELAREIRAAAVVFASGNYGTNTAALSGTDRWDNAASDPVQKILDAKESCFVEPNCFVVGAQAWVKLINNPAVIAYIKSRASDSMGATPRIANEEWFAKAFGFDRVLVGRAKYISSVEGATTASSYIWGKSAAIIRVEDNPNPRMTSTFGYTYRFGGRSFNSEVIPDRVAGVRGGNWIKITHSDAEAVVGGANCGYLYTTVIS